MSLQLKYIGGGGHYNCEQWLLQICKMAYLTGINGNGESLAVHYSKIEYIVCNFCDITRWFGNGISSGGLVTVLKTLKYHGISLGLVVGKTAYYKVW